MSLMRDLKTGRILGNQPKEHKCLMCSSVFTAYLSSKRKYCSPICRYKALLKSPSEKVGMTAYERTKRYVIRNPEKYYDMCLDCSGMKSIKRTRCKKCDYMSRSGIKSPYYKGGYENHLWHGKQRRIKKLGIEGSHTLEQWQKLKLKYNYMCLCCKLSEPEIVLSEDHIIPISKNGTDYIENIQPLCRSCNSRKYNKIINYLEPLELVKEGELL